ncbi:hypothetical protein HOP50_03g27180 [Chloropicon primus]|uniref:Uncharacterized protein n=2 Tax=Chloropicon primus TaxID=1764295 RepID=A0A5B8MLH2_9CHLO|nr:hypothetical protein A3770_03p27180 [Chloropicon primus]UPQ99410.1 hypothetical protein HOP50_03g27180 [Chloropicon primus]|eukprot:QDZ20200.1 hypothetical protein A3770_03p27180 [Chloropicon primus]
MEGSPCEEHEWRKTKRSENAQVSKVKMYSLLVTILLLFGVLIGNQVSDWSAFTKTVQAEKEVVKVGDMVEKEVKRDLVNAEAALVEFEVEEEIRKEEVEEALAAATKKKKKKDKEKKSKGDSASSASGGKEAKELSAEAAKLAEEIKAGKQRMAENQRRTGEERRQYELDRREVEKLEREFRAATGSTDKYDREREKKRKKKYQAIKKHMEESKAGRKIVLDPEVQKVVDDFDGSLKPPEYCYKSPKGNAARPKEDVASGAPAGRRTLLRRRRRKRQKNRASTGGERVPPDWAVLPLNVSREILHVSAEKYPCLILHQDCFDETYNSGAKKLRQWYEKAYFVKSKMKWEEKLSKLEDFKKLRLGTCAVVGNADNVIKGKFGEEIDEHDFVIRYNVITKPFQEAVGSRSDGLFDKMNYLGTEFAPDTTPTTYNLFPKYIPNELNPAKLSGGKKPLLYGAPFLSQWRRDANQMIELYKEAKNIHVVIRAYGKEKQQHASGGVTRVRAIIELLRLGVCDRVDMYGFSSGGGKYFIPRMKVSSAHPIRAENFVYRLWMATGIHGHFCMYG